MDNMGLLDSDSIPSIIPSEEEMQHLLESMNHSQLLQLIESIKIDLGGDAAADFEAQLAAAGGTGGVSESSAASEPSGQNLQPVEVDNGNASSGSNPAANGTVPPSTMTKSLAEEQNPEEMNVD